MSISLGRCPVKLAERPSRVALVKGFAFSEKPLDKIIGEVPYIIS